MVYAHQTSFASEWMKRSLRKQAKVKRERVSIAGKQNEQASKKNLQTSKQAALT